MKEITVIISYRQDDGLEVARHLRQSLHGRSMFATEGLLDTPATLSVYFDQTQPAVPDWIQLQDEQLVAATALLVVCTPGAKYDFGADDCFYREIRWWLANRPHVAPILVSSKDLGDRWIPDIIRSQWPRAQFVKVEPRMWAPSVSADQIMIREAAMQSILVGISARSHESRRIANGELDCESPMTNIPGLYAWEKDRHFRYIRCNDNYAKAAGYDSAAAMLGKSDDDMPWRSLADFFRAGDQRVIAGEGPHRINIEEKEIMVDRVADILVTENQLLDRRGECVGLTGYFLDITGLRLVPRGKSSADENGYYLGKEFGGESLSAIEVEVFKGMMKVQSAGRIAIQLNLNQSAIEAHIQSVKRKLQCVTDGDVVATAIRSGLPLTLFGPDEE